MTKLSPIQHTLRALAHLRRVCRATSGDERARGRTRSADAYSDLADYLEWLQDWVVSAGEGLPVPGRLAFREGPALPD